MTQWKTLGQKRQFYCDFKWQTAYFQWLFKQRNMQWMGKKTNLFHSNWRWTAV